MASTKRQTQEQTEQSSVTPQLEIGWARAVARAADDPAFRQRLESDAKSALKELGVDVPDDVDIAHDLKPSLAQALAAIERQRAILSGAGAAANSLSSLGGVGGGSAGGGSMSGGSMGGGSVGSGSEGGGWMVRGSMVGRMSGDLAQGCVME